MEEMRWKS